MLNSIKTVCIYASSSDSIDPSYRAAAVELGNAIAGRQVSIVFGGGKIGLMGEIARAFKSRHGNVIAVIPDRLYRMHVAFEEADEMIITKDLRERKAIMESRSDAFIALPGGFGTLEEVLEIITLKQLEFHHKPVILLNTNNFFDPLLNVFEHLYSEKFVHRDFKDLFYCSDNTADILCYLEHYQPRVFPKKLIHP
jgi:cytokinin riboside 5'-monophosphate phosphoribohydrolase